MHKLPNRVSYPAIRANAPLLLLLRVPTSPPGEQSGGIPAREVCLMFTTALKIAAGFPIHAGIIGHYKGKCTLCYCCFDHYRMFAYEISVCEVCIIWRKPKEAFKNPSPIVESRTRKPAMVALKIQLDCSHGL